MPRAEMKTKTSSFRPAVRLSNPAVVGGGRFLGEQGGSRQERQEKSRDQNGLLFDASFISRLKEAGYMTSRAFLPGTHVQPHWLKIDHIDCKAVAQIEIYK